ncbi:2Fe-2S iron-sulfur cluster binding domain-containing protein [Mycobacterium europaeum]|uniref:2-polyprenylphenol 6-hydroxylase n=1 Tax=Mycobacterium europaeum TaxID=761804 RepID=A0A0U1D2F8_9MYCO|nr:2Fe-2S iron-sulfur cluster binding domain-containing protein [Mycobacterium europaeum]MEA1157837.1 2Fe-2S iron-sulfur cluster binding domain-containing protein [Mycobacterium europaeum]CQD06787.1 2-polyprenylphenol 6-hydroxylase [Mycobacterium europaeum]
MTETIALPVDAELSSYDVVLVTNDGEESTISCDSQTTVLAAAEQAGMVLKSTCQTGGCGACSAVLSGGQVDMGKHDPDVIEVPENQGGILLCCSVPRTDCRIELPYDRGQVIAAPPTQQQARVTGLTLVADEVMHLKVGLDGSTPADFDSGQFVRITVPGTDSRRAYSPANVANWDGELEFYIRLLPGGLMSQYLTEQAAVGDVLTVSGAQGSFTLAENGLRPRWFLAGGTGLSPLLSMLRRMAEWGDPQQARLFFGLTRYTEVFAQDELAELAGLIPDFRADTAVWQPDPRWTGATGNPVDLAAAEVPMLDESPDVYVCGPPPMIEAAYTALTAAGVPRDQIHAERFFTTA